MTTRIRDVSTEIVIALRFMRERTVFQSTLSLLGTLAGPLVPKLWIYQSYLTNIHSLALYLSPETAILLPQ